MHFKAVELNHLDDDTISRIREWRNQDFVRKMMYHTDIIGVDEHKRYIDNVRKDENRGLFVFYLDDEPFSVFQYEINPQGNYCTSGNYLINTDYQDMGYGTIQSYFIGEIIFEYLKCHKSCGEVLDINKGSISLNKRMGGVLEGVLRQHVLMNGKYHDVYLYNTLYSDWKKAREENHKIEDIVFQFVDRDYEIIM